MFNVFVERHDTTESVYFLANSRTTYRTFWELSMELNILLWPCKQPGRKVTISQILPHCSIHLNNCLKVRLIFCDSARIRGILSIVNDSFRCRLHTYLTMASLNYVLTVKKAMHVVSNIKHPKHPISMVFWSLYNANRWWAMTWSDL